MATSFSADRSKAAEPLSHAERDQLRGGRVRIYGCSPGCLGLSLVRLVGSNDPYQRADPPVLGTSDKTLYAAHEASHPPQVEPVVRACALRAGRGGTLVRDDRSRPLLRLRGASDPPCRRPGCRGIHPLDRRRLDGEPDCAGSHDHDGGRPARDGSIFSRIVQRILRDKPSQLAIGSSSRLSSTPSSRSAR